LLEECHQVETVPDWEPESPGYREPEILQAGHLKSESVNSPTVSVVMSVYNGQEFLSEAVESILGQTFRDFEFVVIDDGSADRTAEILAAFAARDGRLRVLRHENKGRTASLNVGISLAQGKYIARMDADDVALPHRLDEQVDFMERHPEVGLLGGVVEMINAQGQILHVTQPPLQDSEIKKAMLHYNPMCHPTVLIRKHIALEAGGYRMAFSESEDYDLWLRISERSRLANLSKPILQYRLHPGQASLRYVKHQAMCSLAACAAAALRRGGSSDPLSDAKEITPQLLDNLVVTPADVQRTVASAYQYWIEVLGPRDPEGALRAIRGLLQTRGPGGIEQSERADIWLQAAGLHYRQGRPARALISVGRAVLARPVVAGRPVKRALTRLAAALRNRPA